MALVEKGTTFYQRFQIFHWSSTKQMVNRWLDTIKFNLFPVTASTSQAFASDIGFSGLLHRLHFLAVLAGDCCLFEYIITRVFTWYEQSKPIKYYCAKAVVAYCQDQLLYSLLQRWRYQYRAEYLRKCDIATAGHSNKSKSRFRLFCLACI